MSNIQDISVLQETRDLYKQDILDLKCESLEEHWFNVPEDREHTNISRYFKAFNNISIDRYDFDLKSTNFNSNLDSDLQILHDIVKDRIKHLGECKEECKEESEEESEEECKEESEDESKKESKEYFGEIYDSDKTTNLISQFFVKTDYYKVQTFMEEMLRRKWEELKGSVLANNLGWLEYSPKCPGSIKSSFNLNLNTVVGSVDGKSPYLEVEYVFQGMKICFLNDDGVRFYLDIPEIPKLCIKGIFKFNLDEGNYKFEIKDVFFKHDLLFSFFEDKDEFDSISYPKDNLSDFSMFIASKVEEAGSCFNINSHLIDNTNNHNMLYKKRSMCQRVTSFSVKYMAYNSALFLSWALLSTYAKIGLVAGMSAITGPIGIIVSASIFVLMSACWGYSVLFRNLAKKNKIKNKKEEAKENLENNYQNILPIHNLGGLTLEQGKNAKSPVV